MYQLLKPTAWHLGLLLPLPSHRAFTSYLSLRVSPLAWLVIMLHHTSRHHCCHCYLTVDCFTSFFPQKNGGKYGCWHMLTQNHANIVNFVSLTHGLLANFVRATRCVVTKGCKHVGNISHEARTCLGWFCVLVHLRDVPLLPSSSLCVTNKWCHPFWWGWIFL